MEVKGCRRHEGVGCRRGDDCMGRELCFSKEQNNRRSWTEKGNRPPLGSGLGKGWGDGGSRTKKKPLDRLKGSCGNHTS